MQACALSVSIDDLLESDLLGQFRERPLTLCRDILVSLVMTPVRCVHRGHARTTGGGDCTHGVAIS
ncbi:hypothetical protein FAGKG844_140067 [Frankia sp. AgKG'84/4]